MADTDPNLQLRIDVAEMKGMLTQALSDHSSRINNTEQALNVERDRVTKNGQDIGQHTVEITNIKNDLSVINTKLNGQLSKSVQIGGGFIAGIAGIIGVINLVGGKI
jgi:hypothetical protein